MRSFVLALACWLQCQGCARSVLSGMCPVCTNLPTPPPLASTMIPRELPHSIQKFGVQSAPNPVELAPNRVKICSFLSFDRSVSGLDFRGLAKGEKPRANSRLHTTFYSPYDQTQKGSLVFHCPQKAKAMPKIVFKKLQLSIRAKWAAVFQAPALVQLPVAGLGTP